MHVRFENLVSNIWSYYFLQNCRRALRERMLVAELPDVEGIVARIRDHAQQVFDARVVTHPDPQARVIYAYCSLVLAAFREIRAATDDAASAYAFTRAVFQQSLERPWRLLMKVWLWFVRDPVGFLSRLSLARLFQRNQGTSMEFAEEKTDDSVVLVVRRCGFHQFFIDHGEPTLTPVVCAFDRFWLEIMDRSSRPVRTERPTTISTGGDSCRFRFIRDHDKNEVTPTDIILVQLQKPPYEVGKKSEGYLTVQ